MKTFLLTLMIIGLAHCSSTPEPQSAKEAPAALVSKVDRKAIIQTIAGHKKYLSHCYGQTLTKKGNARLKGVVMVSFEIGPDGKARQPQVVPEKTSLINPSLNECLFAGLTSWDFPVHPKGEPVVVRYPFRFRDNPPGNMQNKLDQFEKLRKNP